MRGALPRTPPKDLLGKVLWKPQNLLRGRRDYYALRMSDCGKGDVFGESSFDFVFIKDEEAGDHRV